MMIKNLKDNLANQDFRGNNAKNVNNPRISKSKRVEEVIREGVDVKQIRINEFHPSQAKRRIKMLPIQDLADGRREQEKIMNRLRIRTLAPLSNLKKDSNLLKKRASNLMALMESLTIHLQTNLNHRQRQVNPSKRYLKARFYQISTFKQNQVFLTNISSSLCLVFCVTKV